MQRVCPTRYCNHEASCDLCVHRITLDEPKISFRSHPARVRSTVYAYELPNEIVTYSKIDRALLVPQTLATWRFPL